ncbi:protein ALP1-like [Nasonia vitripennis]|uniref:DDE Tnp4 domain-containing protein n=1 Tax=Nasonia vitripennis TaxID=7425 RepID=A0A7M7T6Y1_NASVI|nr:protein ALP1-like [Nasonia vitripennis]
MPNCIGAIDGKHIEIRAPSNFGSLYFNYKKFNSIVLLATCNHRYEFTLVDVGAYGGGSDGGIFARSELGKSLEEKSLDIPKEYANLPGSNIIMPYYFVGDEAFKLSENLMRPYPGRHLSDIKRIFNYRLSRARRCIENAFGIIVARWRVFSKPIGFEPDSVDVLVLASVCLHNFLMARTQKQVRQMYCPQEPIHQENMDEMNLPENIAQTHTQADATVAHNIRDLLKILNCIIKLHNIFFCLKAKSAGSTSISRDKYQDTREVNCIFLKCKRKCK